LYYRGGSPPAAAGGSIEPGIYGLVEVAGYDSRSDPSTDVPTGMHLSYTMVFEAGGIVRGRAMSVEDAETEMSTAAFEMSGVELVVTPSCPASGSSVTLEYSATPTELILWDGQLWLRLQRFGDA